MKRFLLAFSGTLAGGLLIWMVMFTKDHLFPPPDPCAVPPPPALADEL